MDPISRHLVFCLAAGVLLIPSLTGCKPKSSRYGSNLKWFVSDNHAANNYFVGFVGDDDGIPGVHEDVPKLVSLLQPQNGFNFEFVAQVQGTTASSTEIINTTAEIAGSMVQGDKAAYAAGQTGGTLFFFVSSHGSPDGSTSAREGMFRFDEVAQAIQNRRQGVPLERLIVMFDTCFSGSNANQVLAQNSNGGVVSAGQAASGEGGSLFSEFADMFSLAPVVPAGQAASQQPASAWKPSDQDRQGISGMINSAASEFAKVQGLYKTAIFIGSSRPDETSADTSEGGLGTEAFVSAVRSALPNGGGVNSGESGGFASVLGTLGGERSESSAASNNTSGSSTPATTTAGTTTPRLRSNVTVGQVLDQMVNNALGQSPVWCVVPAEVADDYMFDPPEGHLRKFFKNAAEGNSQKRCSNTLAGN
jgi:hypothetical protein